METLFWLAAWFIIYIHGGYFGILVLLNKYWGSKQPVPSREEYRPKVTTIVAAFNEEQIIKKRIDNLLAVDYPADLHEIIIGSDGSTDQTAQVIRGLNHPQVKVLDFQQNRGRAMVHNDAVDVAHGEIIIFTDAKTSFSPDFIKNIVRYFSIPLIGCVDSQLVYQSQGTAVADTESLYFKLEKRLRTLESNLGILATASGPAMAVRKSLWRPLLPTDDCDFVTPLDVIMQGSRVILAPDAIAYDTAPAASMQGEFRIRIRMTSKNLVGTLRRWGLASYLRHPMISWSLWSHKMLRWLNPFFLLIALLSNLFLLSEGWYFGYFLKGQILFYGLAGVGFLAEKNKIKIPLISTILAFCVANLGIAVGVIKGLAGRAPATYKSSD